MSEGGARGESIRVKQGEADMRLDRWFRVHFPEVGYTYLQKLLRSGQVRVNSKRAQANDRLEPGFEIRVPAVGALLANLVSVVMLVAETLSFQRR